MKKLVVLIVVMAILLADWRFGKHITINRRIL